MVTLLFGFFVILYSFSTVDDKKFDQLRDEVAAAFKAPDDGDKTSSSDVGFANESRQIRALQMLISILNLGNNIDSILPRIEKAYSEGKENEAAREVLMEHAKKQGDLLTDIKASEEAKEDLVDMIISDDMLFSSGGYVLKPEAEPKLRKLAAIIQQAPGVQGIDVVGHTDSQQPSGGVIYQNNFTLSSLRAGAVAEALIRGGLDPKRITVSGMGSLKPLVPEQDAAGKTIKENMMKNRRVHIVIKKVRRERKVQR